MKGVVPVLTFLAGLGIGGAAGWYISKVKSEETKNEEIDESNAAFKERIQELEKEIEELGGKSKENIAKKHSPKESIDDLMKQYSGQSKPETKKSSKKKEVSKKNESGIEVIDESEFDTMDDYSVYSLMYYKEDDILTDEDGDVVADQSFYTGDLSLAEFFKDEDNERNGSVFLRSEERGADYEILLSMRSYEEDYGTDDEEE